MLVWLRDQERILHQIFDLQVIIMKNEGHMLWSV